MRSNLRRGGRLAVALALAVPLHTAPAPAGIEQGRRLFEGELPLAGRIAGHSSDLPTTASRCVNCHVASAASSASAPAPAGQSNTSAASATQSFGPALPAAHLTRELRRRGGPPSRYDEAALCKLLATGVDPAYIIIPNSMPRYAPSPADCGALWAYLTARRP